MWENGPGATIGVEAKRHSRLSQSFVVVPGRCASAISVKMPPPFFQGERV
jgi:hypothetical protein